MEHTRLEIGRTDTHPDREAPCRDDLHWAFRKPHDWEVGAGWGVIVGVSRCKNCGKLATETDFRRPIHRGENK